MATPQKQLHFGLFTYPGGHHIAGWRHPSTPSSELMTLEFWRTMAQLAERGKFDLFFVGDTLFTREKDGRFFGRQAFSNPDPVSLCSVVSAVTERIGLVATLSTTYHEPYAIASKFATLDHVSNGRAGWNIVTTWEDRAALNFSRATALPKADRYARGTDFMRACTALWDSWQDDAILMDRAGGRFLDPARIQAVHHRSDSFDVAGPLRMPRPPQGWPVLVQAGASPPGRRFAAQIAEAIFTAQTNLAEAQAFRSSTHTLMAEYGRPPEAVVIMPGLSPLVADTEAAAKRLEAELAELVHPEVAIWMLSENLYFNFYDRDPDEPMPIEEVRASRTPTSNGESILRACARGNLTIGQAARHVARSRAHQSFVGTPEQLADLMQTWLEAGGCDGFNLLPPYFPEQLRVFVEQVVPVLQRRGIYRRDYEGTTLREHLGLRRPPGRHAG